MKIQVLVATMNQMDHSLLERMNIQSDAIVGNQCERDYIEHFLWNGYDIKYLSFNERGVGLNRNNALMRANADICLFADDDMVYEDGYVRIVSNAFKENPDADVLIFNIHEKESHRYIIKKKEKINYFNYLRYGAVRIAIKLSSIRHKGIFFNQCFGGGTEYSHGEDNIFLHSCLREKLKIYAVPQYIATLLENRESTWNHGYDEKYLVDQGILYKTLSPHFWQLLCIQDVIRHHRKYNIGVYSSLKKMLGID